MWFRMSVGRRNNADPRWLLPIICRLGHVTKKEIGTIRIFDSETKFEIVKSAAAKFTTAVRKTNDEDIKIEPAGAPGAAREGADRGDAKPFAPKKGGFKDRPKGVQGWPQGPLQGQAEGRVQGRRRGRPSRTGRSPALPENQRQASSAMPASRAGSKANVRRGEGGAAGKVPRWRRAPCDALRRALVWVDDDDELVFIPTIAWTVPAAIALAAACCGPVSAQGQAEEGEPLILKVRPSGYDKPEDARTRQEKLLKRLERSDYWVRSICVQCGDAWKHQIYAPFNPLDALGSARNSETTPE